METLYTIISITLVMLVIVTSHNSFAYDESDEGLYGEEEGYYEPEIFDINEMDKRAGLRPVPFYCNGYDHMPRCLHDGKGPRKTWTKSGRFCVCLCSNKWNGPECGYSADALGKRTFPWKLLSDNPQGKRSFPWKLLGTNPSGKRNFPWKLMNEIKK